MTLAAQIEHHAGVLEAAGRSPLYVELMRGAAADAKAGGAVAKLMGTGPAAPGSVPALRLLAALHYLVLTGRAPGLAEHYPNVGGRKPPAGAWRAADEAIAANYDEMAARVQRTVQTNEPGRATVLYGGLLWTAARFRLPVRLLEVGASGGLNLLADRFGYRVQAQTLGAADSQLQFDQPWDGSPVGDLKDAYSHLSIRSRAGCDPRPLSPSDAQARNTLRSYLWPDEPGRWRRVDAALAVAMEDPPPLEPATAAGWLGEKLAVPAPDEAVVVWQSVVDQYLDEEERGRIVATLETAGSSRDASRPLIWLRMEPAGDEMDGFKIDATTWPEGQSQTLARCDAHGPPVSWAKRMETSPTRFGAYSA